MDQYCSDVKKLELVDVNCCSFEDAANLYNRLQKYFTENACKNCRIIISECLYNNITEVESKIKKHFKDMSTQIVWVGAWSFNSEYIADINFKEKVSLEVIKNIWCSIQSSDFFSKQKIEYEKDNEFIMISMKY